MKFTGFYHVLHHPDTAGLTEWWTSLFKTVTAPARWSYLLGLKKALQKALHTPNHCPIYGAVSQKYGFSDPGIKG